MPPKTWKALVTCMLLSICAGQRFQPSQALVAAEENYSHLSVHINTAFSPFPCRPLLEPDAISCDEELKLAQTQPSTRHIRPTCEDKAS